MDNFGTAIILFLIVWVLAGHAAKVLRTSSREKTKREIAAYIAEGSMTPEQGERLLRAGQE